MDASARRRLFRGLRRAGWSVKLAKAGHWKIRDPDGRLVTTTSATPSDHRTGRNLLAVLQRAGWRWPPTARAADWKR